MSKIIAWLVVIFIVLLALRIVNMRNARARRGSAPRNDVAPMVRCMRCGVFLPRQEAAEVAGGHACPEGQCARR